jgi:hypothetical protein
LLSAIDQPSRDQLERLLITENWIDSNQSSFQTILQQQLDSSQLGEDYDKIRRFLLGIKSINKWNE